MVSNKDIEDTGTPFLTELPLGYVVKRDQDGGWTVLNPDGSMLVNTEADSPGQEREALRRALRLALIRINFKLSQQQT